MTIVNLPVGQMVHFAKIATDRNKGDSMFKNICKTLIILIVIGLLGTPSIWATFDEIILGPISISNDTAFIPITISNQDSLAAIDIALKYSNGLKFKKVDFTNARTSYFDFKTAIEMDATPNIIVIGYIWQFSPTKVKMLPAGTGLIATIIFKIIDPSAIITIKDTVTAAPLHRATFIYQEQPNVLQIVFPEVKIAVADPVDIDPDKNLPDQFRLGQNYPNPFNSTTTIKFMLPIKSYVKLKVFNVLGQHITTLADGQFSAGIHTITWDAASISNGIYLYKIITKNYTATKKMIILK